MSNSLQEPLRSIALKFRNVNGKQITLVEDKPFHSNKNSSNGFLRFTLRSETPMNIPIILLFVFATTFIWKCLDSIIPLLICSTILLIQGKNFITATETSTLLVVKSVGIHIAHKKIFYIFDTCEFLPWEMLKDIFINEVVTGSSILPHICCKTIYQRGREHKIDTFILSTQARTKMPGVYVHSVKELGWVPTDRNSVIAIPGAYWLCHKQNIYKFIFRYHRVVRNVEKFEYGRELMKIIRKILKCQPSQGQQFGTQHLRVTYNHTSWTRQDKMFAILKFKDRSNAGAYSRAFVLTIRIFSSENLISNIGYTVLTNDKNDSLFSSNTRDPSVTVNSTSHTTIDLVESDVNPIQKNKQHKTDNHCYLSTISNTNDEIETAHNRSREREKQNSKTLPKVMMNVRGERKRRHDNRSGREDRKTRSHVDNCHYDRINFNSKETITIGNGTTVCNSIHLPNQYLIENEMELKKLQSPPISSRYRTKVLKSGGFLEMKENETDELKYDNKKCKRKFFENFYKNRFYGRSKIMKDSSIKETNKRTSNITDLVMKGRMFTIAQNKDSVCVVEEKTKLEIDEVLENSEKVKTDKGEECLLNSSLLKLESLISKMELPKPKEQFVDDEGPTNSIDSNDENFDLNDTVILDEDEKNNSMEIDDARSIISGMTFVSEHIPFQGSSFVKNDYSKIRKKVDDKIIIESNTCNVPRIVSCEIITLDQMCPALQNALRNKILNKNNNETLEKCCTIQKNQDNTKIINTDDGELNMGSTVVEELNKSIDDEEVCEKKSNINETETSDRKINSEVIFDNQLNENDISVEQEKTLKTAIENVPSINILKFIADITRGAKVVLQRLTLSNNL